LLVENGSKIELKNKNGDSPLNAALRAGHREIVEFLLAKTPTNETSTFKNADQ
jgi:ankyrin repeat protein